MKVGLDYKPMAPPTGGYEPLRDKATRILALLVWGWVTSTICLIVLVEKGVI